jgi:hypothetical protein
MKEKERNGRKREKYIDWKPVSREEKEKNEKKKTCENQWKII